jgi:hypothetical protein
MTKGRPGNWSGGDPELTWKRLLKKSERSAEVSGAPKTVGRISLVIGPPHAFVAPAPRKMTVPAMMYRSLFPVRLRGGRSGLAAPPGKLIAR